MRPISSDELIAWAIIIVAGLVLAMVHRGSRPLIREMERQKAVRRRRIKHLLDPLAGDSYWGMQPLPIFLPIVFLALGIVSLRLFYNPLWGGLFLLWAAILALAIWLDRKNRQKDKPDESDTAGPDMVVRWLRVTVAFLLSLAVGLFLHALLGIAMAAVSLALAGLTWRMQRRLIADQHRQQQEARTVISDARRMSS